MGRLHSITKYCETMSKFKQEYLLKNMRLFFNQDMIKSNYLLHQGNKSRFLWFSLQRRNIDSSAECSMYAYCMASCLKLSVVKLLYNGFNWALNYFWHLKAILLFKSLHNSEWNSIWRSLKTRWCQLSMFRY